MKLMAVDRAGGLVVLTTSMVLVFSSGMDAQDYTDLDDLLVPNILGEIKVDLQLDLQNLSDKVVAGSVVCSFLGDQTTPVHSSLKNNFNSGKWPTNPWKELYRGNFSLGWHIDPKRLGGGRYEFTVTGNAVQDRLKIPIETDGNRVAAGDPTVDKWATGRCELTVKVEGISIRVGDSPVIVRDELGNTIPGIRHLIDFFEPRHCKTKFDALCAFPGTELTTQARFSRFSGPEPMAVFRFTGWNAKDLDAGQVSFKGWGGADDQSVGKVSFAGWRDPSDVVPEGKLSFKGWRSTTNIPALSLAFKGWSKSDTSSQTALTFEGWNGELIPVNDVDMDFQGWRSQRTAGEVTASFRGAANLQAPCHPQDILSGVSVAIPVSGEDGHLYQTFSCETDWASAAAACALAGAHLVTIGSGGEQQLVARISSTAKGSGLWIGASDSAEEGQYRWLTGEQWNFTNWNAGEPNNQCGDEDYVHIRADGYWNDQFIDGGCRDFGQMGYVCEWTNEIEGQQAVVDLTPADLSDWEGVWLTKRGTMTVHLAGANATVVVDPGGLFARWGGAIEVTQVTEGSMKGLWNMPLAGLEGSFLWTLKANRREFDGQYSEAIGDVENFTWWGEKK